MRVVTQTSPSTTSSQSRASAKALAASHAESSSAEVSYPSQWAVEPNTRRRTRFETAIANEKRATAAIAKAVRALKWRRLVERIRS